METADIGNIIMTILAAFLIIMFILWVGFSIKYSKENFQEEEKIVAEKVRRHDQAKMRKINYTRQRSKKQRIT